MKTAIFSLALASLVAIAASAAPAADLAGRYERNYTATDNSGCSCDAPGVFGLVCATPSRCREMDGLCVGACTNSFSDSAGCSCDAPGVTGLVCATPRGCREMSGLCVGGC